MLQSYSFVVMCVLDTLYVVWSDNYCWLTFVFWPDNIIIIDKKVIVVLQHGIII
jgi:hypothetical protein